MIIVGIDPGTSGCAIVHHTPCVSSFNICFDSESEVPLVFRFKQDGQYAMFFDYLKLSKPNHDIMIYLEKVHSMPSDSPLTAFKFGQEFGRILGGMDAIGIPVSFVHPQKWQEFFECPKGMKYADRKRWLQQKAQKLFPTFKVTLDMADAVLISEYGRMKNNG